MADIHASPGQIERIEAAPENLIPIPRAGEGCLPHDLQDDQDLVDFLFHESWAPRELWRAHLEAPFLGACMQATEGAVAESTLHETRRIG